MSARTVGLAALGLCLGAGCSSTPNPAPLRGGAGGSGASGGTSASGGTGAAGGTGASGGSAGGGAGGSAGQDGGAGSGGSGGKCGDGVVQSGEECDGTHLNGQTCKTLGFDSGSLACKSCKLDSSGCTGQEHCTDGVDNDGDHLIDCADPDCTAKCADPCANVIALSDPGNASGFTAGHATLGLPSCGRTGGKAAPAVAYSFTAAQSGVLDIGLTSSAPLVISVRTSCSNASSETFCSFLPQSSVSIQKGNTVYVLVTGPDANETGAYTLSLGSRVPKCGDGIRDSGEECDDGNPNPGDGCSATCTIESDETEPNDTVAQANSYVDQFHAQIKPSGDVDVVKVTLPSSGSALTADTFDYGDGACYKQLLDSAIDIIGTDGTTVIASDDDSGSGLCAHAVASGLAAGTYYVRVKASPFADTPTFPYVLNVAVQ
jgi:cysteine-rich repeat protein